MNGIIVGVLFISSALALNSYFEVRGAVSNLKERVAKLEVKVENLEKK